MAQSVHEDEQIPWRGGIHPGQPQGSSDPWPWPALPVSPQRLLAFAIPFIPAFPEFVPCFVAMLLLLFTTLKWEWIPKMHPQISLSAASPPSLHPWNRQPFVLVLWDPSWFCTKIQDSCPKKGLWEEQRTAQESWIQPGGESRDGAEQEGGNPWDLGGSWTTLQLIYFLFKMLLVVLKWCRNLFISYLKCCLLYWNEAAIYLFISYFKCCLFYLNDTAIHSSGLPWKLFSVLVTMHDRLFIVNYFNTWPLTNTLTITYSLSQILTLLYSCYYSLITKSQCVTV